MTLEEARERLRALQQRSAAFSHAMNLIYYDGVTGAPRGVADNRAQTLGVFGQEMYLLSAGPETAELLEYLDGRRAELDRYEARQLELLLKEARQIRKIPMDRYVEFQKLMVEADDVWHTAKENNDWPLFEPVLERVFDFHKQIAAWCAPEKRPYDYWLDRYEEGLTMERCDAFFAALRARIVPLLKKVLDRPRPDASILKGDFPAEAQERFSHELMRLLGLDPDRVGLATTEHPFTISLGSHLDERITTHYHTDDFSSSMFSVIHEGGHALYDTGSARELAWTALDCGVSMGIHESQSRFYENILGRSRAFCEYILPVAARYFPSLRSHSAEELYRAVNRAEPGPIRIEADELTYALHVMVRYELEKRIFAGELEVRGLPAEWDRLYKEYLGVEVPDDRRGVLQDSHWAGGNIGYFPSYALGSAYGAQYLRKMKETLDVDALVRAGDLAPINGWLRERIWRYGCLYKPGELFERAVGEPFDPAVFADYLEAKYTELYGL